MKRLRCKPGDLAFVVHDIPQCMKNVGRIVRVEGPLKLNRAYQLHCWLIRPLSPGAWYVDCYWEVRRLDDLSKFNLEHPDEWLLPIRPDYMEVAERRAGVRTLSGSSRPSREPTLR